MSESRSKRILARESLFFFVLFLLGIIAVPFAIFWIGSNVLGQYGGDGFGDFFGRIGSGLMGGDPGAWFLVLSPYLGVQLLRLTWLSLRRG